MGLLNEKCWVVQYEICLQLHEFYAEAQYCSGRFEEMNKILCKIFNAARSFDDKLRAYFTFIEALGAQGKLSEALEVGLYVLSQLGESISMTSNTNSILTEEVTKTGKMLEGKTDAEILALKEMDNFQKIAAMRFLVTLSAYAYFANQDLSALLSCRMIQMTLIYGVCKHSAIGFVAYGSLLSCAYNDISGGYRFGQLSITLLKKFKAAEHMARIIHISCSMINSYVEHHHASLQAIKEAHTTAMKCGDIQLAMGVATQYCVHSFQCGVNLSTVEKMLRECGQKMKENKQHFYVSYIMVYRQFVLNLIGHSDDPLQLTGEAMDQESVMKFAIENKRSSLIKTINEFRCLLAYIFGEYTLASQLIRESDDDNLLYRPAFSTCTTIFIEGLISSAIACKTNVIEWKKKAFVSIEKIRYVSQHAPSNYQHMLVLLQAESSVFLGDNVKAAERYDNAIRTAGEDGFIHNQAIAFERAGMFYLEQGNAAKASHYYGQAHDAYLKWGAKCKADHLRLRYPF